MVKAYNPKYKREKSKEKFEKLKAEVEEKFAKEHTFKPNLNYDKVFSAVDREVESREEIYKRLSTPKIVEINKRIKEKEVIDKQKMTEECTFKPNIGNKELLKENEDKEKVENRLFKLAEQMKEKREKLKREYQDNLVKDFSFTPRINETSQQLMLKYEDKKPLHERYEDLLKNKKQYLQQMRQNQEKEEKNLYKPEINPKSKEIIMRKTDRSFNGDLSIHERLYREGINQKQRNRSFVDNEHEICTFSPNLFYSTTQPGGNIDDFLERQKIYEEIKKERLERKLSKSIEHKEYTFNPRINLTSDILMKADHNRANEDLKDKVERLYKDDFEKLKNRREQLEKFYYAQYDFKPKINEISKFIGKDHTVEELYQKRESSKVRRFKDKEKEENDGCTFKPKINKDKFENIQSNYKLDDDILHRIKSEVKFKNEKVEEIKAY